MGQYEYPNLLSGTRSGKGWKREDPAGVGAVTYDKTNNYLALHGTSKSEFFLKSPPVVLHKDTDYTLHCFAANTTNMSGTELFVLDIAGGSSSYQWIGAYAALKTPGPGAWLDWTFRLDANARDGVPFQVRFDNNGSTNGQNCLIWFRDIMLTEGTEPHAWAPAEGEVWPE